ncbi:hypothetical protein EC912_10550 [Luteibacter rhizovicinus]|uniref:Serine/threonine protein kinase n=1 Tax=Luteibacter rhizovicinus TaxID=242606 RepID=A0A4R3YLP9_9GAMM|nr:hypothetical protein [Luteibacter rhizovicinus]TCV93190.1 hypothetical protein EC912_10550 [Luteibacter rhizovicinus]
MELDDMKLAWQALDRRLDRQHALNLRIFRGERLDKVQRGLRPLRWGLVLQIVFGACMMLLFAPFWVTHRNSFHLMLCGLLLHAYGLMYVLSAARNFYLLGRIDYAAPVIDIQKRLADLRAWRLKEALLMGITGCLVWIPFVLVLFKGLGADLWLNAPSVVWWMIASSMVPLVALYGLVWWSRRPGHERFKRALGNSGVGSSINKVQGMLDDIARFEQE